MLGYSDLLLNTNLSAEQQPLAAKIGQYVRRTKSLVASLISFARQTPAPKTLLDLNTLARTAVKLTQPQWESLEIEVHTQLDPALPKVLGDSNQLLQVCLQLIGNALHLLSEQSGRNITISTGRRAGICVLQIATEPLRSAAAPSSDEDGLALSACQGILQEHQGQISREVRRDGAVLLQVELPAADPVPSRPKEATVPMWQSRPYA
jgi:two-component system, NtrC family, sensor kinase